jgi:hypothetical protein
MLLAALRSTADGARHECDVPQAVAENAVRVYTSPLLAYLVSASVGAPPPHPPRLRHLERAMDPWCADILAAERDYLLKFRASALAETRKLRATLRESRAARSARALIRRGGPGTRRAMPGGRAGAAWPRTWPGNEGLFQESAPHALQAPPPRTGAPGMRVVSTGPAVSGSVNAVRGPPGSATPDRRRRRRRGRASSADRSGLAESYLSFGRFTFGRKQCRVTRERCGGNVAAGEIAAAASLTCT